MGDRGGRGEIGLGGEGRREIVSRDLSALTLRAWKYAINNTVELPPMDVYRAVAWIGWVGNLIVAEWLIRRGEMSRAKKISLHKREMRA
jgi:hypothetical protein